MNPIPKKLYDILTWVKIILAVAIPLVIGLDKVWNIPYGYQIIQTLTVVEAAVIGFLKFDSIEYFSDKVISDKEEPEG
jgi:hypothetical protein